MQVLEISRDELEYTSHFCEENIYKLTSHLLTRFPSFNEGYSIFLSNPSRTIPIWCQRLSDSPRKPVVWDYHVVFLAFTFDGTLVQPKILDFDSILPFPINCNEYLLESFRPEIILPKEFHQLFRVVPMNDFHEYFASDRSHMNESDHPFPSWPCIQGGHASSKMNLNEYIDMETSSEEPFPRGQVFSLQEFFDWIEQKTTQLNQSFPTKSSTELSSPSP